MEQIIIRHKNQVILASGLDVLAGIWLIISPFVLHFQEVRNAAAIDPFFGILICILAGFRVFGAWSFRGLSWFNVIFGIWIFVSPFCLGFYHFHIPLVNNLIAGAAVIILATWSALATATERHSLKSVLGESA